MVMAAMAMADMATTLTSPTVAAVATTAVATAISAWGSYAIVLIVLGWMLWRAHLDRAALKDETAALRAEVASLNAARLEDSKQLIRVTESSTALQQARSQGDQLFLKTMQDLATQMAAMRTADDGIAGNRHLLEDLVAMLDDRQPGRAPRRPARRESR